MKDAVVTEHFIEWLNDSAFARVRRPNDHRHPAGLERNGSGIIPQQKKRVARPTTPLPPVGGGESLRGPPAPPSGGMMRRLQNATRKKILAPKNLRGGPPEMRRGSGALRRGEGGNLS